MAEKSKGGRGGGGGARSLKTRVKTARGRKTSSTRWLQRQLNDPYVQAARAEGWRSRAAYKLIELDEKFRLLRPGQRVLDLGAAPGGWSQVAARRVGASGRVVAVDINPFDALPDVAQIEADVCDPDSEAAIRAALAGPADLVISDMAPPASGHRATDHLRIVALVEAAADLAAGLMAPGGAFVAKVWHGGADSELLAILKRDYARVRHAKPPASRSDSAEIYLVAQDFRAAGPEGT